MAAGVPATGIGGIYYILLTIGLLLSKLVKKVCSIFKKQLCFGSDTRIKMVRFFPTLAFTMSTAFLIFMNATGFRFVIPGIQPTTPTLDYFWEIGIFAVATAVTCFFLINYRAQKTA
jgi:hypothetical protein